MSKIRFKQAEANYTRLTGEDINEELYLKWFPDCNETTRRNQVGKLKRGQRKEFEKACQIIIDLCEECFVDPNFLFGFKLKD